MLSIKKATLQDLSIVHDLAYKIWPSAYGDILSAEQIKYMLDRIYSLPSLEKQLDALNHIFIIVSNKTTPVGFASFSPEKDNSSICHLHKIYVLPEQQGTGTGKFLLGNIINFIKSSGATTLTLNVNRYNKARFFYEKRGFKIIREEDIDIGNGYFMNDYIMELDL